MRLHRWLPLGGAVGVTAAVAVSLGATCGPGPPSSDNCQVEPGTPGPTITAIDIGRVGVDGRFTPFTDDQVVPLTIGGQGASMVVANLRVTGSGVGDCLPQMTRLEQLDGSLESSEEAGLVAHLDGADTWVTGDAFLVYYGPSGYQVRIHAEVGGLVEEVVLWVDQRGVVDAGPDDGGTDGATDGPWPDGCLAQCNDGG